MRLSDQERSAAQEDLDRLTGELVRLYQLREQLKLALKDGEGDASAAAMPDAADPPLLHIVHGGMEALPQLDPQQRQALRSRFQLIQGGVA